MSQGHSQVALSSKRTPWVQHISSTEKPTFPFNTPLSSTHSSAQQQIKPSVEHSFFVVELRDVLNWRVFGELRNFGSRKEVTLWRWTEGGVEIMGTQLRGVMNWEISVLNWGIFELKRSCPFVFNWCVELRGMCNIWTYSCLNSCIIHYTFSFHSDFETFFEATCWALPPITLIDDTLRIFSTLDLPLSFYCPSKKSFASFASQSIEMISWCQIIAD